MGLGRPHIFQLQQVDTLSLCMCRGKWIASFGNSYQLYEEHAKDNGVNGDVLAEALDDPSGFPMDILLGTTTCFERLRLAVDRELRK
jgi:hypothetical protein